MKRLIMLLLLPLLLPDPVPAQAPERVGPAFSMSLGMAAREVPGGWAAHRPAPGVRATVGVAKPGAELYLAGAHFELFGPSHGLDDVPSWQEEIGDRIHEQRLTAGMVGIRLHLLDGPLRVGPFFEAGLGLFQSVERYDGWVREEGRHWIDVTHELHRTRGWVQTIGGGFGLDLQLGGGFALGLQAGATDIAPWREGDPAASGRPRAYHAGAMLSWSRRSTRHGDRHRAHPRPSHPQSPASVDARPGVVVIGTASPPVRALAELSSAPDGTLDVVLSGGSAAVEFLMDRLKERDGVRPRVRRVEPTPEAADPLVVTLDLRLASAATAELLAYAPGVDRIDPLVVRLHRASATEAADFIELVLRLSR